MSHTCFLCKITMNDTVATFPMPKTEYMKEEWNAACGIQLPKDARLCVLHFADEDVILFDRKHIWLRWYAVPTQHLPKTTNIDEMGENPHRLKRASMRQLIYYVNFAKKHPIILTAEHSEAQRLWRYLASKLNGIYGIHLSSPRKWKETLDTWRTKLSCLLRQGISSQVPLFDEFVSSVYKPKALQQKSNLKEKSRRKRKMPRRQATQCISPDATQSIQEEEQVRSDDDKVIVAIEVQDSCDEESKAQIKEEFTFSDFEIAKDLANGTQTAQQHSGSDDAITPVNEAETDKPRTKNNLAAHDTNMRVKPQTTTPLYATDETNTSACASNAMDDDADEGNAPLSTASTCSIAAAEQSAANSTSKRHSQNKPCCTKSNKPATQATHCISSYATQSAQQEDQVRSDDGEVIVTIEVEDSCDEESEAQIKEEFFSDIKIEKDLTNGTKTAQQHSDSGGATDASNNSAYNSKWMADDANEYKGNASLPTAAICSTGSTAATCSTGSTAAICSTDSTAATCSTRSTDAEEQIAAANSTSRKRRRSSTLPVSSSMYEIILGCIRDRNERDNELNHIIKDLTFAVTKLADNVKGLEERLTNNNL